MTGATNRTNYTNHIELTDVNPGLFNLIYHSLTKLRRDQFNTTVRPSVGNNLVDTLDLTFLDGS